MVKDELEVIGACENNLQNVSVVIPKNRLVVFAGVSGSGKSSLIFETIARESQRQWQDAYPMFIRNKLPHYQRPDVEEIRNLAPSIVVDQKALGSNVRSTVGTITDLAPLLRLLFSRVGHPSAGGSMAYSPNHPVGMCPVCNGLKQEYVLIEERIFDMDKSLNQGAINFSQFSGTWQSALYLNNPRLNPDKKLCNFSEEEWNFLKYGSSDELTIEFPSNNTGQVAKVDYEGVIPRFNRLYLKRDISKLRKKLQEEVLSLVIKAPCQACQATGLNQAALASKILGHNILDYQQASVEELLPWLAEITDPMGSSLAQQISQTIRRMVQVGIGYLSLERQTSTLSGGELQRIKLVRHLGSSLSNVNYIFDEPTTGLHPHDARKISQLLLDLRDQHNNVLVVEHNQDVIKLADHIIELGPKAGRAGGKIVFQGDLVRLQAAQTLTAQSLQEHLTIKTQPRQWQTGFKIENANRNNLQNVTVTIPKGILTAVTGVAGSGKSSLIRQEFLQRYPNAIMVNQKPIGTSIRSTPATYLGFMDKIRKLFGKANKISEAWFSFNSKGACPICKGSGRIVYDMAFADKVEVLCEECQGHRYNPQALAYQYQGLNIEEVLHLTVEQAYDFFDDKKIRQALESLKNVGLEYLQLGQATSTLSGGEIQRLKLASRLGEKGQIFILDEPSIGLHNQDLHKLLHIFNTLVDQGNTVIMIEHRLELIAQADWVLDMGPKGGRQGGQIVFEGLVKDLLECPQSLTGKYLKQRIKE